MDESAAFASHPSLEHALRQNLHGFNMTCPNEFGYPYLPMVALSYRIVFALFVVMGFWLPAACPGACLQWAVGSPGETRMRVLPRICITRYL